MRYLCVLSILLLLAFCAAAQQEAEPVIDSVTIDGVVLDEGELTEYNRAVEARGAALRNTKAFVEQVVAWIDATAPHVIDRSTPQRENAETLRVQQMRSDFVMLDKRAIAAISQENVTGADIRERTLSLSLEAEQRKVNSIQSELDVLSGVEEKKQDDLDRIANTEERLGTATAARDAAQTALDNWKAANP